MRIRWIVIGLSVLTTFFVIIAGYRKEHAQSVAIKSNTSVNVDISYEKNKLGHQTQKIEDTWKNEKWIDVDRISRPLKYIEAQSVKDFLDFIWNFGKNEQEIQENIGQPVKYITNGNFTILYYDGMYISIYKDSMHDYVHFMAIKSAQYQMPMGIKIGSSQDEVLAILGYPPYIIDGNYIYPVNLDITDGFVVIYLDNGRISKITWDYGMV